MLGWSIMQSDDKKIVHISQGILTKNVIKLLKLQISHPATTLYNRGIDLFKQGDQEPQLDTQKYPHSKAIGMLRYLVGAARLDLAYIAGSLARHMQKPATKHWNSLKKVVRYLKHTEIDGLRYTSGIPILTAESDSDFAGCLATTQSTSTAYRK